MNAEVRREIAKKDEMIKDLKDNNGLLNAAFDEAKGFIDDLERENTELRGTIGDMGNHDLCNQEIAQLRAECERLKGQLAREKGGDK